MTTIEPCLQRKIDRLARGAPPRVLDLFAGCGGLSLGFHAAGYDLVAGVEIDPHAAATYGRNLHGGSPLHMKPRDLTRTSAIRRTPSTWSSAGRPAKPSPASAAPSCAR
ncbi:MAG TPA: DNA cytosine methyltransferase [Geminicoccaceae bacterium]|nr:DNA cytosine methyltransferase [Geminicoccaceae bacterium]